MIRSFKSRKAQALFEMERVRALPPDILRVAFRKLRMLHRAQSVQDLRVPPGNQLEAFKGERAGQRSIRINDRWRVCFIWKESDA